jgi:hypothetical protein
VASRIIRTMPVWGLSALAAGSIGASLSNSGLAEVRPRTAFALDKDTIRAASYKHSRIMPSAPKKFARNPERPTAKAANAYNMKAEFVRKGQRGDLPGDGSTLANTVIGNPAVTASVAVAAVKSAINVPLPAAVANGRAISIVDVLQVAPANVSTNIMAAASAALPKLTSGTNLARSTPTDNRAIYGTSANNAYKVYFPQIEYSAPAGGDDLAEKTINSPAQDTRVLTKQGSYLFYEDQSEQASSGKIIEVLKAGGVGSGNGTFDGIVDAAKKAEARELTAPVLQKVPLNFGDRSLDGSSQKANAPSTTPDGNANAG